MEQYLRALQDVHLSGEDKETRNAPARSKFGHQMRFNLQEGFPIITTKYIPFHLIKAELLWFLEGSTSERRLAALSGVEPGKTIWAGDAYKKENVTRGFKDGELGPIYGYQWRSWPRNDGTRIDQLATIINQIKANPHSRRHIVNAWNVSMISEMILPPCHVMFQFYVDSHGLSLQFYQRSCDMFLGVPFNISSYALLLSMVAQVTNHQPYEIIHTFGDYHLYHNHFDQAVLQLSREPKKPPGLWLNPDVRNIDMFTMEDIELKGYEYHNHIPAPLST